MQKLRGYSAGPWRTKQVVDCSHGQVVLFKRHLELLDEAIVVRAFRQQWVVRPLRNSAIRRLLLAFVYMPQPVTVQPDRRGH